MQSGKKTLKNWNESPEIAIKRYGKNKREVVQEAHTYREQNDRPMK